jgi:hypothetical protein
MASVFGSELEFLKRKLALYIMFLGKNKEIHSLKYKKMGMLKNAQNNLKGLFFNNL